MVAVATPPPSLLGLSSGQHAHGLVHGLTRRLDRLIPVVLADNEPEDLHQLRVALRRLRSVLQQFSPALVFPPELCRGGLAAMGRRTGRARDFDVLLERLQGSVLPLLPASEQGQLQPFLAFLHCRRRREFRVLRKGLRSKRSRHLQDHLRRWCADPRLTPLGRQPLLAWLLDWHLALVGPLFLHPGWFSTEASDPALHGLRKAIKNVRYGLDHLQPVLPASTARWVDTLKLVQATLGELHDLEVMAALLRLDRNGESRVGMVPVLATWLAAEQASNWDRWQHLASRLLQDSSRQALLHLQPEPTD